MRSSRGEIRIEEILKEAGLNFKDDLIPLQVGFKENVAEILNKDDIKIEGVCAGAAIYSTKALEAVKLSETTGAVDHPTAPLHINHKMTCDTCTCGRS